MTFEPRRPGEGATPSSRQSTTANTTAPAAAREQTEPVMALAPSTSAQATANRLAGAISPWRKKGKLFGHPPVRDEFGVPNINIGESESAYKTLLAGARSLLKGQRDRADAMLSKDKTKVLDYRYWFAKVYSYVTEQEIRYCEERTFDYPSYVMQCVLYFDKIYADNLKAAQSQVEPHWKAAFQSAHNMEHGDGFPTEAGGVLFALVASMLAHIRFDLPRAEAWVAQSYGQKYGAKPSDFKPDFFRMSGVFDIAGRKMYGDIQRLLNNGSVSGAVGTWAVFQGIQANLTDGAMRYVMGADMSTERLVTWRRMTALVGQGLTPQNPYTLKDGKLTGDITKTPQAGIGNLNKIAPDAIQPVMAGIQPTSTVDRYGDVLGGLQVWGQDFLQDFTVGNQYVAKETKAYRDSQQRERMVPERHATMLLQLIYLYSKGFDEPDVQQLVMLALKTAKDQGSLVMVVNMVDAFSLVNAFPPGQRGAISDFLLDNYYTYLESMNAANLIIKWNALGSRDAFIQATVSDIYLALPKGKRDAVKRILAEEDVRLAYLR
ncbi:DUF5995 family protein [Deinococcus multiflagellatus]|uniref:DUF5995 family protein n=1 Tax=Deinococcus multiflagellatus TaxID=1656887 RepID=A0ABW1ZM02_9DEIO|nr:DUF5995 family protein [Deinococcus multiflagellatus]MBZ9714205.1 DUF5995 family protein [Deinococcus multiflagellatus]